jgi:hypothetical protein
VRTFLNVGFEVLTAVSAKMAVFWVVALCSLVEVYQRFGGPCCLHLQGDDGNDLWNIGKLLPDYTVQQPRRQPSSFLNVFFVSFTAITYTPLPWYQWFPHLVQVCFISVVPLIPEIFHHDACLFGGYIFKSENLKALSLHFPTSPHRSKNLGN